MPGSLAQDNWETSLIPMSPDDRPSPRTPGGHRPPSDWYSESRQHILSATGTRTHSDTMRYQSHSEIDRTLQRTENGEHKVDSALKAKIGTTKGLKELLEGALQISEKEIERMEITKDRLDQETTSCSQHLRQNEERRLHRQTRPSREMVHDYPYKLFESQAVFLHNSYIKYEDKRKETFNVLHKLHALCSELREDLGDKTSAIELDMKCIALAPVDRDTKHVSDIVFSRTQPFLWSSKTKSKFKKNQSRKKILKIP